MIALSLNDFYENAKGDVLPAGTLLKVIGVFDHQNNSRSNQADIYLCETEDFCPAAWHPP